MHSFKLELYGRVLLSIIEKTFLSLEKMKFVMKMLAVVVSVMKSATCLQIDVRTK